MRARLSYEQQLSKMSGGLGDSSFLGMPQVSMPDMPSGYDNLNEKDSSKHQFVESIHYRDLKLYNNESNRYDLDDMRSVRLGNVVAYEDGLFLETGEKLDVIFQLIK